ncbi:MAG TPA: phospholipase D-like domain-containing protein, partial [Candidatus Babeliaceae bacterium]|nr:phospholipase D-like domain-containing protein [Candidatus Babeliaceae bacterium]
MPMFFRETLERILFVLLFCAVTLIGVGIAWEIRIWSDPGHYAQRLLIHDQAQIKKALFTPDDDVKQILLGLIKEEKTEIIVAAFSFTDGDIAQAIIDAYQRGVAVTLVVERTNAEGNYTKVPL